LHAKVNFKFQADRNSIVLAASINESILFFEFESHQQMMLELISRLAFIITVNCYLLGVGATAFSSPALSAGKNSDRLNGAHLKFAVAHVNIGRHFYFTAMAKQYVVRIFIDRLNIFEVPVIKFG
jgi:hypothetical protein